MGNNYQNFMKDLCFYLVEEFNESKNYETDFENGVNHQLWTTLNHIKNRSKVFGLDQKFLGIDNFNPDEELSSGKIIKDS